MATEEKSQPGKQYWTHNARNYEALTADTCDDGFKMASNISYRPNSSCIIFICVYQ